jgi:hypothetical protein
MPKKPKPRTNVLRQGKGGLLMPTPHITRVPI